MNPNRKKRFIAIGSSLFLLFFLIFYILRHADEFRQLATIGLRHSPIMVLATFLFVVLIGINGFLFHILLIPFQLKLPMKEWCGLAMVNNFYNLITPFRGGMAVQALYLKQSYQFAYTHFLAVHGALQFFTFFTATITVLMALPFIGHDLGKAKVPLFLFFLTGLILQGLVLVFSPRLPIREGKWYQRLARINNGWIAIKGDKRRVIIVLLLNFLQRVLKAVFLMLTYYSIGIKIDFSGALFISAVGIFSLLISVLPGNLGIDDVLNVFSANLVGVPIHAAIAATLLGRMINMVVSLSMGPLFSYVLLRKNPLPAR